MGKKHTPTPWTVTGNCDIYCWPSTDNEPKNIEYIIAPPGKSNREIKANAEFICRAVNNHYQLVEALQDIKTSMEYSGFSGIDKTDLIEKAKQALAKATA